jgi:hypothetical protein
VTTDEYRSFPRPHRVDEMVGVRNPETGSPAEYGIDQAQQRNQLRRNEGRVHGSALPLFE